MTTIVQIKNRFAQYLELPEVTAEVVRQYCGSILDGLKGSSRAFWNKAAEWLDTINSGFAGDSVGNSLAVVKPVTKTEYCLVFFDGEVVETVYTQDIEYKIPGFQLLSEPFEYCADKLQEFVINLVTKETDEDDVGFGRTVAVSVDPGIQIDFQHWLEYFCKHECEDYRIKSVLLVSTNPDDYEF